MSEEKTLLEFETYLFGLKNNNDGFFKIPKTYYTLTTERLKVKKQGVMTQKSDDMELFKLKDVTVKQKLKDKMMDVGDIEIISSDESDPVLILKNIKDPHGIREKIREAARNAKKDIGITYRIDL